MTDSNCRRWMSLSDREATGESLSESDQKWHETHAASCRHCAGEARFWSALGEVMDRPELLGAEVLAADARATKPVRQRWRRPSWRSIGYWSVAAGVTLLASSAVWMQQHPRAQVAIVTAGTIQLVSVSGDVRVGSRSVRAGEVVAAGERIRSDQGRACFTMAGSTMAGSIMESGGILACLDAKSEATVSTLDPSLFSVRLERGRLMSRLEQQSPQRRYVVLTSRASVVAKGTAFVVDVDEQQRVSVHLHEGQLEIQATANQHRAIRAPGAVVIGEQIADEVWSDRITSADRDLLALGQLSRGGQAVELDVMTRPVGASVWVDDMLLGPTPTSAAIHGGHRLSVSLPGYATVTELLPTEPGQRLQRNYEMAASPVTPNESAAKSVEPAVTGEVSTSNKSKTSSTAATNTPHGLLARAQSLRAEGKLRDCATVYRQLVASFAGSDEARVATVSLGELELSELNQAALALKSFENYLLVPGPLTREARFGRIRALQMLSRKADEQAAIAAFLKDYPNSVQAERLRRRVSPR